MTQSDTLKLVKTVPHRKFDGEETAEGFAADVEVNRKVKPIAHLSKTSKRRPSAKGGTAANRKPRKKKMSVGTTKKEAVF